MITTICIVITSLTFLASATLKLRAPEDTFTALSAFGLPPRLAHIGKVLLPIAEVSVVALVILPATVNIGAIFALGLLTLFSLVIAQQLRRGRHPSCSCFGSLSNDPISSRTLIRNGLLALPAVLLTSGVASSLDSMLHVPWFAWAVALNVMVTLAVGTLTVLLWQQHGRLLERIDQLETSTRPAPSFRPKPQIDLSLAFSGLRGDVRQLRDVFAGSEFIVGVLISPSCSPCKAVIAELASRTYRARPFGRVIVLSSGSAAETIEVLPHELTESALLTNSDTMANEFGSQATPSAVVLDARGTVTARASGREGVTNLLRSFDDKTSVGPAERRAITEQPQSNTLRSSRAQS